jgi:ribose 5-phosphate isomerase A
MSEAKRLAGEKAIEYVEDGMVVGVGTGSTVAFFIDALARIRHRIEGAVSSSEQSTQRLRGHGIEVLELNDTGPLPLYVDGADECDLHKRLIKGGGAALTREKIIAQASTKFVSIIDPAKRVDVRGLAIADPAELEREINQWPGVVTVGIFARNRASVCLLGTPAGVRTLPVTRPLASR